MKNVISMGACCILLGMTGTLRGQVDDPAGPFEFSLKVEAATTDNRDASPDGESNTDFLISPRIHAIFMMERSMLDFYYEPSLRYRTDPRSTQNDEEFLHDLGVSWRHSLTPRLTLRLSEHFNYTDDPAVEEGGGTLRRDSSFIINRVQGTVSYDINRQSRFEVDGWHRMKAYEESELEFLDEESISSGARYARQVSRTVSLSAEARAEEFTYEYEYDELLRSGSADRSFTAVSGGVGIENDFMANCRASLRVGMKQLDYEDDEIDSNSAPYVIAILKLAAVPSTRFTLSARHELRDSDVPFFASQKYTDVYAGMEWDATPRVTVDASGTYRLGEYEADTLPSGLRSADRLREIGDAPGVPRASVLRTDGDETAVILRAGVSVEIAEKTRLRLGHQYENEDSDVSVSYTRNETTLGLIRTF